MLPQILLLLSLCACAQVQEPVLEFEVASIRPSPPPEPGKRYSVYLRGGPGSDDPTRLVGENMSHWALILAAYDMQHYQVVAPEWTRTTKFNLTAKIPEGATKDQYRLMLQKLLADRFGLVVHREKKETQVYELTVGKNGHKMKESPDGPDAKAAATPPSPGGMRRDNEGFPEPALGQKSMSATIVDGSGAHTRMLGQPIETLVRLIANELNGPVIDATGLKGKYDFTLFWAMERLTLRRPAAGADAPPGSAPVPEFSAPPLITAVQQQLGLKLESKKGTVDMLVVDRVEKVPTEN